MKHPGGNPSTLFCEQVSTVTLLFEKWNDCERAVVMYALLKRLSFPTLKFLQFSIESNLTQNFGSQKNLSSIETNANNPKYLQKLISTYKAFPIVELSQITDKDSILYESDLYLSENEKNYYKKEDILHDVLSMIPLLKPGNDDAKSIYLSLIPLAVEDTVRQIVAADLVQQIFSYLLIHPAISNDDRRSLSHWLRHLEDHIQSSFASTGQQSFYLLSNPQDITPPESLNTSFSSMSGNNQNTWQAIAPPSHKQQHQQVTQQLSNLTMSSLNSASSTSSSDWNLNILHLPTPVGSINNNPSSSQNSLGLVTVENNDADTTPEDLHVSFSKNGTEVLDFDDNSNESDTCNTKIASIGDHLHVPSAFGNFDQMLAVKTRRSNSLTTPSTSSSSAKIAETMHGGACSNSSENLAQFAQKPRSYSLSIESPHNSLRSSGSETHLDDLKPNYLQFTTHNIGMSSIGQWLKSLRLHKYIGLFTNVKYEEMLGITEEYLQSLGVTKGASHKLALCIQKLQDRVSNLSAMEMDLLEGRTNTGAVIDELSNIVLTPMKPIDNLSSDNVAGKFIHVLDIVSQIVIKRDVATLHDEECVNATLWVLERALHNEAFVTHTNQLKEYKFKLSKLKMHFMPKSHHTKTAGGSTNINKPRWNSSTKPRKTESNSKSGSSDRIHRKNSNEMPNFTLSSLQKHNQPLVNVSTIYTNSPQYSPECDSYQSSSQQQQPIQYYSASSVTTVATPSTSSSSSSTNSQYKSSSYPSFSTSASTSSGKSSQQQSQQQQQPQQQQQQYRHRHSLNNLIVLSANPQQQQQVTFKTNKQSAGTLTLNKKIRPTTNLSKSVITLATENQLTTGKILPVSLVSKKCCSSSSSGLIGNLESLSKNSKNTIGDINTSLEFLCLQMTEQAIN